MTDIKRTDSDSTGPGRVIWLDDGTRLHANGDICRLPIGACICNAPAGWRDEDDEDED